MYGVRFNVWEDDTSGVPRTVTGAGVDDSAKILVLAYRDRVHYVNVCHSNTAEGEEEKRGEDGGIAAAGEKKGEEKGEEDGGIAAAAASKSLSRAQKCRIACKTSRNKNRSTIRNGTREERKTDIDCSWEAYVKTLDNEEEE